MRQVRFALIILGIALLQTACGTSPALPAANIAAQQAPPLNLHWVDARTIWRYWAGSAPDANWQASGFDDSAWAQGTLPLGTDGAAQTRIAQDQTRTVYLRTRFNEGDPSAWRALTLLLDYEDGAAVYLNGQEIARVNLDPNAGFGDAATAAHDTPADTLDVTPALGAVRPGTNVLAVEVHPAAGSTSLQIAVQLIPTPQSDLAHLLAGPILGVIGTNTVTIRAESDIPAQAIVEFGISDGTISKQVYPAATNHTLMLSGLKPGAIYHYRLGLQTSAGINWSSYGQWTTNGGAGQSFRFAVWGDSRPSIGSAQPTVFGQLLDVLRSKGPLALAISVGDNVQLSRGPTDARTVRDRYLSLLTAIAPLAASAPFYSVVGNHDEPDCPPCLDGFRQYFALPQQNDQTYYSFDYGPAHFTVVNSRQDHGSAVRAISDDQWKWLQQDLAGSKQQYKFVFLHDSIYHEAKEEDPSFSATEQDRLHELFVKNQVTAVFMGHSHYYDYYERDGIAYVITGGGGSPLYGQFINPNWEKNEAMVVGITPDQVILDTYLPDGTTLDHRTLYPR